MPKGCRIHRVPWTEDEDNILQEYYPKEGGLVCHRLPGRTRNACKNRAQYIRLQPYEEHKLSRWTEEEEAILKEYYPTEREAVHLRLPGRTASACQLVKRTKDACKTRAKTLGLRFSKK